MARELGDLIHLFVDDAPPAGDTASPPSPAPSAPLLRRLHHPLDVLAQHVATPHGTIQSLARDEAGRPWIVLDCTPDQGVSRLAAGLAHAGWVAQRLGGRSTGLVLIGGAFDAATRDAARALGPSVVRLVTVRSADSGPTRG